MHQSLGLHGFVDVSPRNDLRKFDHYVVSQKDDLKEIMTFMTNQSMIPDLSQ